MCCGALLHLQKHYPYCWVTGGQALFQTRLDWAVLWGQSTPFGEGLVALQPNSMLEGMVQVMNTAFPGKEPSLCQAGRCFHFSLCLQAMGEHGMLGALHQIDLWPCFRWFAFPY